MIARNRQPLFGERVGETIDLSVVGEIIRSEWERTGELRPDITLDEFVIMPDHFHAILFISEILQVPGPAIAEPVAAHRSAQLRRAPRSLGAIIAGFKSAASRRARQSLWQRNYYDRVIRDEEELNRIRNYITYNPAMLSDSMVEIWNDAK